MSEYDFNRVQYWRPVYTLSFEFENGNSTSVAQKQKLIPLYYTLSFEFENGNSTSVAQKQKLIRFVRLNSICSKIELTESLVFDFVRLPNSIELNPRIEFD